MWTCEGGAVLGGWGCCGGGWSSPVVHCDVCEYPSLHPSPPPRLLRGVLSRLPQDSAVAWAAKCQSDLAAVEVQFETHKVWCVSAG